MTGTQKVLVDSQWEGIISMKAEKKCRGLAAVMGSAAAPAQLQAISKIK
jgi:hypothetical protein